MLTEDNYSQYLNDKWFNSLSKEWKDYYRNRYKKNRSKLYLNIYNTTEIYIDNSDLDNLEGVKYCINLIELNCSHNELTSLKGIENCKNLKELDCSHNFNLESLNGIENCINLEYLACQSCKINNLLPLKFLIRLKYLYVMDNKLSNLDNVENLFELLHLQIGHNPINYNDIIPHIKNCYKLNLLQLDIKKRMGLFNKLHFYFPEVDIQ